MLIVDRVVRRSCNLAASGMLHLWGFEAKNSAMETCIRSLKTRLPFEDLSCISNTMLMAASMIHSLWQILRSFAWRM
jgi:hypothetical protein